MAYNHAASGLPGRRKGCFPLPGFHVIMAANGPKKAAIRGSPMSQRLSLSAIVIFFLAVLASVYFAFAAIQGPSGVMRRIQLQDETKDLLAERDTLQAEVNAMKNLTHRLSDEYLDLDLLDERAREVLGLMRPDEVIIR